MGPGVAITLRTFETEMRQSDRTLFVNYSAVPWNVPEGGAGGDGDALPVPVPAAKVTRVNGCLLGFDDGCTEQVAHELLAERWYRENTWWIWAAALAALALAAALAACAWRWRLARAREAARLAAKAAEVKRMSERLREKLRESKIPHQIKIQGRARSAKKPVPDADAEQQNVLLAQEKAILQSLVAEKDREIHNIASGYGILTSQLHELQEVRDKLTSELITHKMQAAAKTTSDDIDRLRTVIDEDWFTYHAPPDEAEIHPSDL